MRLSFKQKIYLGFGLALLILSLVGANFYLNTAGLAEATGGMTHVPRVLEKLDAIQAAASEAGPAHQHLDARAKIQDATGIGVETARANSAIVKA